MSHSCDCHTRRALVGALAALPVLALASPFQVLTGQAESQRRGKRLAIQVKHNDTLIRVGGDALLAQAGADIELEHDDQSILRMVLKTGRVLSVFEPNGAERTLENNGVIAGIRGTAIYTHQVHGETYLCCCYGAVDLDYAGQSESIDTPYHQARVFEQGGIKPASYRAPAFHFDDELVLLEHQVGREPHWTLPAGELNFFRPGPLPRLPNPSS